MKTKQDVLESLSSLEQFKTIMKDSFLMSMLDRIIDKDDVNSCYAIYNLANKKGVYDNILLRTVEYDGSKYGIYAFSCAGEIPEENKRVLRAKAALVDTSSVIYDNNSHNIFRKLLKVKEGSGSHMWKSPVAAIASGMEGVIVYTLEAPGLKDEFPYSLYASKDGYAYIYPVSASVL